MSSVISFVNSNVVKPKDFLEDKQILFDKLDVTADVSQSVWLELDLSAGPIIHFQRM